MKIYAIFKTNRKIPRPYFIAKKISLLGIVRYIPIMEADDYPVPEAFESEKKAKKWLKKNMSNFSLKKGIGSCNY